MKPIIGVVIFPGSLDDRDAMRAVSRAGATPVRLWHADDDLHRVDAVILPGGFSYGDYLRCGAIARFAPVMRTIADAARGGMPVLGICNGFQILCEARLLPGAFTRNQHLHFRNRDQRLRIDSAASAWTNGFAPDQEIVLPVKNGEGRFVADVHTLDELEADNLVVARYIGGNPNGSLRDIAAIRNPAGNVVGIMPHPEHAIDELTGPSSTGLGFFGSVLAHLAGVSAARPTPAAGPASTGASGPAESAASAAGPVPMASQGASG